MVTKKIKVGLKKENKIKIKVQHMRNFTKILIKISQRNVANKKRFLTAKSYNRSRELSCMHKKRDIVE